MAFFYSQFDGLTLPSWDDVSEIGTAASQLDLIQLPNGGIYDQRGSDFRAPRQLHRIVMRAAIVESDAATLRSSYYDLLGKRGVRGSLQREKDDGGTEWCHARLDEVRASRDPRAPFALDVTLVFVMLSPHWNGTLHNDNVTLSNASPTANSFSITNDGNTDVKDVEITVAAVSSDITTVDVSVGSTRWVYSGTIAAGTSLVINCGRRSVYNNGSSDYANFALSALHAAESWCLLEPGNNSCTVYRTGGGAGSTIEFEFYDGWE